jgi:hypothetical protein
MSYTWTQTLATTEIGAGITCSSSGKYVYSAFNSAANSGIYISSDYGLTWTQTFVSTIDGVASDSSGQYPVAVVNSVGIYRSIDYGSTWGMLSGALNLSWMGIASSSSGQYLNATVFGGGIYTSSNYGLTWSQSPPNVPTNVAFDEITSSSSGQYVYAIFYNFGFIGGIYRTTDYGSTWTQTSAAAIFWIAIACSSSGELVYAVYNTVSGGGIYKSHDYGVSWGLLNNTPPNLQWDSIATNSSGEFVYATVDVGGIYISPDYGSSWTLTSAPSNLQWNGITSTSSGPYLFATVAGGGIYRGTFNTNYIVNGVGDISTLFLPLSSGTPTTSTGYLYNIGTIGTPNYLDLSTLFAPYFAPPLAPPTSFKSSLHGGNDLNQVFQNIEPPISYTVVSSSNINITQYPGATTGTGYNAVTFECSSPTTTVGLASITSFVSLNNVTIIIVGGGGGGSYDSGQGGGGGGSLTYTLTTAIPTSSTYNIQVGNGGTGGIAGIGTPENGVNGATSFLTVIDNSPPTPATILDLEATGGQGGLSWVLNSLYPTLGGGGIGNAIINTGLGSLTLVGGGGGSGGSYLAAGTSSNAANGGIGGTPSGSGTLSPGAQGANCTGTTAGGSYSGNGGNSGLTSVAVPFSTNPSSITLGGGGGGSSNKSGSNQVGSWAGAAGKGIGGKGSINNGYSSPGNSYPYVVAGSGTSSLPTGGYGGGGGAGCFASNQAAYGGNGGAGCVILYWPVPP